MANARAEPRTDRDRPTDRPTECRSPSVARLQSFLRQSKVDANEKGKEEEDRRKILRVNDDRQSVNLRHRRDAIFIQHFIHRIKLQTAGRGTRRIDPTVGKELPEVRKARTHG